MSPAPARPSAAAGVISVEVHNRRVFVIGDGSDNAVHLEQPDIPANAGLADVTGIDTNVVTAGGCTPLAADTTCSSSPAARKPTSPTIPHSRAATSTPSPTTAAMSDRC
jgi:hypothetical protein